MPVNDVFEYPRWDLSLVAGPHVSNPLRRYVPDLGHEDAGWALLGEFLVEGEQ